MACHGPDFFDLARIGTLDSDIIRRARLDGASEQEAQVLLQGVRALRGQMKLRPVNARQFRPFQPGGAVLPGATRAERDIAFGEVLRVRLPLLMNGRVGSLAQARAARDQVLSLDIHNTPIGIALPRWSADFAHGAHEGTMDDWVADTARIAIAGRETEWIRVQDAYLAQPSTLNFWRLYFAVDEMTQGKEVVPAAVDRVGEMKFKSALIGQHALRAEARGDKSFIGSGIAFAYLGTVAPYATEFAGKSATKDNRRLPGYLPNPMWILGELGRTSFGPSAPSLARDRLASLGYPGFVVDSVDPAVMMSSMQNDLRLSWFMLGTLFDPGLQRIDASNSTLVGEYFDGSLNGNNYFIHRAYTTLLRKVHATYNPQALRSAQERAFTLNFGYFAAYDRHRPTGARGDEAARLTPEQRKRQIDLYKIFVANMFRMSLYLHEAELDSGRIAPYGATLAPGESGGLGALRSFFEYAGQPELNADMQLLERVAAKAGVVLP